MHFTVEERSGEHVVLLHAAGVDGVNATWAYENRYTNQLDAYRIKRTLEELADQDLPINLDSWHLDVEQAR